MSTGSNPFFAVDGAGGVSPPGPPATEPPARAKPKNRPKFPIPTDRLSFERQEEALRAVCVKSRQGQDEVTAVDMAAAMNISAATAPLNNAFFISVGLMDRTSKAGYKPTDLALRYANKWTFDKAAAPSILRPAFFESWFYNAVRDQLEINPGTSESQMIEVLAAIAGTDASYATQYGTCLAWLEYVGLASVDDGVLRLTNTSVPLMGNADIEPIREERTDVLDVREVVTVREVPAIIEKPIDTVDYAVNITFHVRLTADDLAKLDGDAIKTLFTGAAEIAAINAKLS